MGGKSTAVGGGVSGAGLMVPLLGARVGRLEQHGCVQRLGQVALEGGGQVELVKGFRLLGDSLRFGYRGSIHGVHDFGHNHSSASVLFGNKNIKTQ